MGFQDSLDGKGVLFGFKVEGFGFWISALERLLDNGVYDHDGAPEPEPLKP